MTEKQKVKDTKRWQYQQEMGVPKLPRTSAKRWPFRKAPTIVALFSTVLVLLVAIEWNLLNSSKESIISVNTYEDTDKKNQHFLSNNAVRQRSGGTAFESGSKRVSKPPSPTPTVMPSQRSLKTDGLSLASVETSSANAIMANGAPFEVWRT